MMLGKLLEGVYGLSIGRIEVQCQVCHQQLIQGACFIVKALWMKLLSKPRSWHQARKRHDLA